jgi:lysophospholipase L1-like esterase
MSGEVTPNGLARLLSELSADGPAPAVVVLQEGVNDCLYAAYDFDLSTGALVCGQSGPFAPQAVMANLETMADAVRARGAVPLIATLLYVCPMPDVACRQLPMDDPAFCPALGCWVDHACNLEGLVEGGSTSWIPFALDTSYFLDFLHPNEAGSEILAQRTGDAIAAVLSVTTTTSSTTTSTMSP